MLHFVELPLVFETNSSLPYVFLFIPMLWIFFISLKQCRQWKDIIKQRRKGCSAPKKATGRAIWFGVDHLWDFMRSVKAHTMIKLHRSQHLRYGNTFASDILGATVIHTSKPKNLKTILSTYFESFDMGPGRRTAFSPFLGDGIFTSDGAAWFHARRLIRPSVTRSRIGIAIEKLDDHVTGPFARIPRDGSTVDLQPLMFSLTLDIATSLLFGESAEAIGFGKGFSKNFELAEEGMAIWARLGFLNQFYGSRKFFRACGEIHKTLNDLLDRISLDQHEGFISELVSRANDRKTIRDHIINLMFVGRDTIAGLLSITIHVLARRKDVWSKLQDETVILEGRKPTIEEIRSLTYLRWVLKGVMRLWPIVPVLDRQAYVDTILPTGGGPTGTSKLLFLKGQRVAMSIHAMHRRPDLFGPDAEEFRSER